MKKQLLKHIAVGLIVIIPFASCNDFLEENNPNEMSTDTFWKTLEDLNSGLIGVYNSFKNGNILAIGAEYNRSDMTWPGWGRPNTNNPYYLQNFNEAAGAPNGKWEALYKGIFRANQVIKASEDLMGTFGNEDQETGALHVLAQARFLRGLFYFYLHNSFNEGKVIIYDFVPKDEADFSKPISAAEEVQNFYLTDLEFAHQNLPPIWNKTKDKGRVTAGAAAAVLGKSYLYDGDYQQAATYFRDVIENPEYGYALTASIGDNFTTRGELNEESILEINYSLNYKSEISVWAEEQVSSTLNFTFSPVGGWRSVYPSSWLIMAYKRDSIDINDPRNQVIGEDGLPRFRKYSLRTSYSIALVDDPDMPYYQKTTAQAARFNNKETAYYRKYTNWDIVENEKDIVPSLRSGVNVRVIRLADVYLMYAESLIQGSGNVEEAMTYINRVRHRSALQLLGPEGSGEFPTANHDGKIYNAQSLMDHLMYVERPLELSVEGNAIRHIDMRRWGITKQRFEELSKRKYNADHFKFVDEKGENKTRWGSVLMEVTEDDNPDFADYVQAAVNYIESAHAYWPLPNSEIVANPELVE
ncbi:RagB/SusD family nutrient uptake outer membrane protein [Fulvivirgaceae bacterium BMA12]|uniref:RagB/SusD family nutrient uptake outer membrane protein n=1 Tax=Agaribacillus aureus TaxID=3051825 RepID=A0ABT8L226_9BACT|nr:RagB/SusD family nutrient uptake outer membrane protein [Fulvivirgaceae bacterium BMA12]